MHLAYEIQIANQTDLEVTLDSVQAARQRASRIGRTLRRRDCCRRSLRIGRRPRSGNDVRCRPGRARCSWTSTYPAQRKPPPKLRHAIVAQLPSGRATRRSPTDAGASSASRPPVGSRGGRGRGGAAASRRTGGWSPTACCEKITAHRGATLADQRRRSTCRSASRSTSSSSTGERARSTARTTSSPAGRSSATDPARGAGRGGPVQDGLPEQVPAARCPRGDRAAPAGGNYIVVDDRRRPLRLLRPPPAGQPAGEGRRQGPHRAGPRPARQHRQLRRPAPALPHHGRPLAAAVQRAAVHLHAYRGQGVVTDEAPLFSGLPAPVDAGALTGKRQGAMPLNDQLMKFQLRADAPTRTRRRRRPRSRRRRRPRSRRRRRSTSSAARPGRRTRS